MKFIATISVDLEVSPLGTRSRLRDDLHGKSVLRRTVERVLAAECLDAVHVLSPIEQSAEVARLLDGLPVEAETHVGTRTPYAALVRAGRWWGLDGWRGGIGGMCVFDEDVHIALLAALAQRVSADAVVSIPAAAPVVSPAMIDAMTRHYETHGGTVRMTIVQAPPGLGAVVFGRSLLGELLPVGQPPGVLLAYSPDHPAPDATGKEACYRASAEVIEARGRLICDTRRSIDRVGALLGAGGQSWDAARIASWLSNRCLQHVDPVPEEIEIELTTEDPLSAGSLLRPRGDEVGRRGPIALETIRSIAAAIADYDDVRIVLGGFGEPCCHPEFPEICRLLRDSSAAAIAVRTGASLDNPAIDDATIEDALFETPVDVIEVTLDAATPETYRRAHGVDAFESVAARLDRWISRRSSGQQVLPLIVPSLVKANETLSDMQAFFDTWQRRLGTAVIRGYSHCAGQRPDRAVTSTAPPHREVCRRVFSRTLILADGRMTTCDQDFAGRQTIGRIGEASLGDLWRGERLASIRANALDTMPLCRACEEWHRP
ncbi:MAG: SPASM domain-containing protein [Phycisphaerae bacterium]|nr:SPASM domain-containing protein [Phycisphaerae bacterium]